jgi:hypothetical protein
MYWSTSMKTVAKKSKPLSGFVPHLIVTHPLAARDNLELYRMLGGIFGREKEAEALCADFEHAWAALGALANGLPRQRVLYLIWREPWLSVARDTYISRMLAAAGWDTLPLASLVRYPEIDLPELAAGSRDRFSFQRALPLSCQASAPLTEHLPGIRVASDRRRNGLLVRQSRDPGTRLSARAARQPRRALMNLQCTPERHEAHSSSSAQPLQRSTAWCHRRNRRWRSASSMRGV